VDPALVTWSSSNPGVASVVSGIVTGQSAGQASITATYGGKSVAVDFTVTPGRGGIAGTVSSGTRGPLAGVTVSAGGTGTTTGAAGTYSLSNLTEGTVTVSLGSLPNGCTDPGSRVTNVIANSVVQVDFLVTCTSQTGTITGIVSSPQRGGLAGVSVTADGQTTATGGDGSYSLNGVGIGMVAVSLDNLPSDCSTPSPQSVTVPAGGVAQADFSVTCGTGSQGTPPDFSCSAEGTVKSLNSNTPVLMTFRNQTNQVFRMFWLDVNGARVYYPPDVQPGTDWTIQQTYLTHPWLVLGVDGHCYGIWLPSAGRVVIVQ
jgi:hypothetical protein